MIKKYFLLPVLLFTTLELTAVVNTTQRRLKAEEEIKGQKIKRMNDAIDNLKAELVTNKNYLKDNPQLSPSTITAINKSNTGLQELINTKEKELYALALK